MLCYIKHSLSPRRQRAGRLLAAVLLLTSAAGCYHQAPYGGYPGYPQAYPQGGVPGGYVMPQGGQYLTPATPGGPATLTPTPDYNLGSPSSEPFGGGTPDNWQTPGSTTPGTGGAGDPYYQGTPTDPRVPDRGYGDPSTLPPAGGTGDGFEDNSSPFGAGAAAEPMRGPSLSAAPRFVRPVAYETAETGFLPPVEQASGDTSAAPAANVAVTEVRRMSAPAAEPQPAAAPQLLPLPEGAQQQAAAWGYDRENYRWLRGVVEFDQQDGQWHLMYDPQPGDRWGGDLTLAGGNLPETLQDGAVIQVHGQLDQSSRDSRGKPLYQVERFAGPLPILLPATGPRDTVLR
ncbi:MAG: hypothetical protein KDA79_20605 [Planctomycetaceae bacterium]|nr:hypothetical protein [Planctomycetaceae bacterium]